MITQVILIYLFNEVFFYLLIKKKAKGMGEPLFTHTHFIMDYNNNL